MGNASLTSIMWTMAAVSGLLFFLVIVVLARQDWHSVPRTPEHEATLIVAKANLRLFTGLALVQLCWSGTGFTAIYAIPGQPSSVQQVIITGGLLFPSYLLPLLALLELVDRRRAYSKIRYSHTEEGSQ